MLHSVSLRIFGRRLVTSIHHSVIPLPTKVSIFSIIASHHASAVCMLNFRNLSTTSRSLNREHIPPKVANVSKRGPKFRTPSKMQDASTAFGVKEASDDERQVRRLDWNIWAYATAEEYQMEPMGHRLRQENSYEVSMVTKELPDVLRLTPRAKTDPDVDHREIFVFSTGAVVFWDVPPQERRNFLNRLRPFEQKPYDASLVNEECERLVHVSHDYSQDTDGGTEDLKAIDSIGRKKSGFRNGKFRKEVLYLDAAGRDDHWQLLERYTVSNVMSASVQLSMWESDFEHVAATLEDVTDAMNKGKISLHKKLAISYAGRLTSLRHNVSLHSDLLDHPDFYWEREGLAKLYDQASEILCIRRRVNVFNKKLDDAMALIQLIMQELAVSHSSRLEWLIIYLICIEVIFDAYHCWKTW